MFSTLLSLTVFEYEFATFYLCEKFGENFFAMDFIMNIVKFGIFLFNFILMCVGGVLIVAGASGLHSEVNLEHIKEYVAEMSMATKLLIGLGIFIFMLSFFGCWGAFAENTAYLKMYAILLLAIVLVEIVMGMYVYLKKDAIKQNIEDMIKVTMATYDTNPDNRKNVDAFQKSANCCGVNGPKDWTLIRKNIPRSCCPTLLANIIQTCDIDEAYQDGCFPKLYQAAAAIGVKIMWILVGVIGFEALVIFFSLLVRNSILESRRMSI